MKVWELEEGKEYVSDLDDGGIIYKIINGDLFYKGRTGYMRSYISYTTAKDTNFTEYTPPTDWSKVEVDTKVLVRDFDNAVWLKRYFAVSNDGEYRAYSDGKTSWNSDGETTQWNQMKLYKEDEQQ